MLSKNGFTFCQYAAKRLNFLRYISSNATRSSNQTLPQEITSFRSSESDPRRHNINHVGLFYTIPKEVMNKLFILGGFDKSQQDIMKALNETSIMIREPALEVMRYLDQANYSRPVIRYILCTLYKYSYPS